MRLSTVIQDGQDVVGVVEGNDWFSLGTGLRAALVQGVDLFARAFAAHVPEAATAGAILPDQVDGLLWVPVAAAAAIERASLEAWMAGP